MTGSVTTFSASGPMSRQWLAVACSADTENGPVGVRLLGRDLVLWRGPGGVVVAAPDQCTHSRGTLSKGTVDDGRLACPKHGWAFGAEGRCVFKPSGLPIADSAHLKTYPCAERYGLIWVSLGEPAAEVVDLGWDRDESFRRIYTDTSVWKSNPVRIVEAFLAESDSWPGGLTAELPFLLRATSDSDDQNRWLLACAPADGRTTLVTATMWTNSGAGEFDDAIVSAAQANIDRVKADVDGDGSPAPSAESPANEDDTPFAKWKQRLLALVGQTTA